MRKPVARAGVVAIAAAAAMFGGVAGASASTDGAENDPVQNTAPDTSVTATKLSHSDAKSRLSSSGISISSSGGCSDRQKPNCTSLDQVNLATIQGVQTLKKASGCGINVTGGTEVGHASGTYSHYNGYKLDTSLNSCLTSYIKGAFTSIGGSKWESASGNVYYLEGNHWDITFHNCGGC